MTLILHEGVCSHRRNKIGNERTYHAQDWRIRPRWPGVDRHYDQCGLLKPNELDPDTGYRYYSLDQLPRVHRLLALKDLGFSLEQIAQFLEEALSLEHLRGMFTLKQAQTQQMIGTEQARLTRIAARLCQIEQEGRMPAHEVLLKQVDALFIASVREMVRLDGGLGQSYGKVAVYLERQGVQPGSPAM